MLLLELSEVGLQTEVRQGDESSLLIFVRAASKSKLKRAVYQSRYRHIPIPISSSGYQESSPHADFVAC